MWKNEKFTVTEKIFGQIKSLLVHTVTLNTNKLVKQSLRVSERPNTEYSAKSADRPINGKTPKTTIFGSILA